MERIALGMSNRDIGNAMGVSMNTVRAHVRSAMQKVGVSNRAALAVWYVRTTDSTHRRHTYGGVVFEETGETRPTNGREWFTLDSFIKEAYFGAASGDVTILRPVSVQQ